MNHKPLTGEIISIESFENKKFVIGEIYSGGMGYVYQLVSLNPFENSLALKTYKSNISKNHFEREARIWFSIGSHKNIAAALWYGFWENQPSIISDWYPMSLSKLAIKELSKEKIFNLVKSIINGLAFAYESSGVIHQDIKPENILIDKDLEPKISDFGISILQSENENPVGGTPGYIAPEILKYASPSIESDIYSLGITLLVALSGLPPLKYPNTRIYSSFLRKINDHWGDEINPIIQLIKASTQIDVRNRPSSYDQLLLFIKSQEKRSSLLSSKRGNDIVAKSSLLYKQGRITESINILINAVKENPNNPLILNALACTHLKIGEKDLACSELKKASEFLRKNGFKHSNSLYLDPVVNLASIYIESREFGLAKNILKQVYEISIENDPSVLIQYPEFGWLYLYEREYLKSYRFLSKLFNVRLPDPRSIKWFILSAYLSDRFIDTKLELYRQLILIPNFDTSTSLLAILVSNFLESPQRRILHEKSIKDCHNELEEIEHNLGIKNAFGKLPLEPKVIELIINSLKSNVFEEKKNGII